MKIALKAPLMGPWGFKAPAVNPIIITSNNHAPSKARENKKRYILWPQAVSTVARMASRSPIFRSTTKHIEKKIIRLKIYCGKTTIRKGNNLPPGTYPLNGFEDAPHCNSSGKLAEFTIERAAFSNS